MRSGYFLAREQNLTTFAVHKLKNHYLCAVETEKRMFTFRQFTIEQDRCAMKVGTDGVLLGAWAELPIVSGVGSPTPRVLDIGTGTGVVALMMAQRYPDALVDAVEIDADAASQAGENVARSPFASRVRVFNTSIQDFAAASTERYDVIVSNPPYFQNSLRNPDAQRSLARHADSLPFSEFIRAAAVLLKDDGVMSIIIPTGNTLNDIIEQAIYQGFLVTRQTFVKTSERRAPKRCLLELARRRDAEPVIETQCLSGIGNTRSEWYANITKDFYL